MLNFGVHAIVARRAPGGPEAEPGADAGPAASPSLGPGRLHALIDGVFAIALTLLVLDLSAVRFINRRFLERTLVFLLFISIIPWPTALASNYADQGVPQARAAAVLYAATMLMMGLSFTWGWRYLSAHPELVAEPARPAFPAGARRALLGGLVYLAAIAVAFLSPTASFAIDAFVAVYFAASKSKVPGLIVRSADADGSS
jgi:uncharacterized membrane protein